MLTQLKAVSIITRRTYKNFGHKRQPIPGFTVLWQGFLTFTFMGMCLDWNKIGTWVFGDDSKKEDAEKSTEQVS